MPIPSSAGRVPAHTAGPINERIRNMTEASIEFYSRHPERINARLAELEAEWDIERVLETQAATLALAGAALGLLGNRKWLIVPGVVAAFLLQHAVQGWCPPIPALRRLGVRTPQEIEAERYALKVLRGDFREIPPGPEGAERVAAATGRLYFDDGTAGPRHQEDDHFPHDD
jgi:hypothetical protein